jgi:3-hydroxyacyl-[acyl-carrier-protein] dehydratase
MRFLLFDRVAAIEPGRRIEAVACFSLKDEHHRGGPRRPLVPASMVLEAMLQALGWLVVRTHEFRRMPFLSLLEDATLPPDLAPGTSLRLAGELLSTNPQGSVGRAEATADGRPVASIGRVLYGHFPVESPDVLRRTFAAYEARS